MTRSQLQNQMEIIPLHVGLEQDDRCITLSKFVWKDPVEITAVRRAEFSPFLSVVVFDLIIGLDPGPRRDQPCATQTDRFEWLRLC